MPDGATLRDHYLSLRRQTGMRIEALEQSEEHGCPDEAQYLWEYFLSMNERRTGTGYGPNALSNQEVIAWAERRGVSLSPFENAVIDKFEAAYLRHCAKQNEKAVKNA